MNTFTLKSGNKIPKIGLGTWQLSGVDCSQAVRDALNIGYNHIDTAIAYENHKEVALGISESGRLRESFFLTSKIPMDCLSYSQVLTETNRSLNELQVEYLDLMLIHWPTSKIPFSETLMALNEVREKGYVKDIGISNFNADITAEAKEISQAPIVTNQVEFHPLLFQKELLEKCTKMGIMITAYSPLARGKAFKNSVILDVAKKYGVSVSQVCIAWLLEKGIVVIPKATGMDHLKDNLNALNIKLETEDIRAIDEIPETVRLGGGSWQEYEF